METPIVTESGPRAVAARLLTRLDGDNEEAQRSYSNRQSAPQLHAEPSTMLYYNDTI